MQLLGRDKETNLQGGQPLMQMQRSRDISPWNDNLHAYNRDRNRHHSLYCSLLEFCGDVCGLLLTGWKTGKELFTSLLSSKHK
jgi:hypothetical protein